MPIEFSAALCRGLIEAGRTPPQSSPALSRFSAALCRGLIEASRCERWVSSPASAGFPRLYAAASLKPFRDPRARRRRRPFSAALCRGLIEARTPPPRGRTPGRGFPRLYAAASLKRPQAGHLVLHRPPFSAALCRGLIEAPATRTSESRRACWFSAALCRGLIEARCLRCRCSGPRSRFPRLYAAASLKPFARRFGALPVLRFPRLYAAASLKHSQGVVAGSCARRFSAALCRGLIEARSRGRGMAAARTVFRGFMPRPH